MKQFKGKIMTKIIQGLLLFTVAFWGVVLTSPTPSLTIILVATTSTVALVLLSFWIVIEYFLFPPAPEKKMIRGIYEAN
tara:strand:+ start:3275 stop:3511 length:237 start_codon:yes stop_codon:yes gene_type:complete